MLGIGLTGQSVVQHILGSADFMVDGEGLLVVVLLMISAMCWILRCLYYSSGRILLLSASRKIVDRVA